MKKVLIIGINGFVGTHLFNELNNNGYKCYGADINVNNENNSKTIRLDILDTKNIIQVLNTIKPNYIINLAAVSSVKLSWDIPQKTFDVNVKGTINLLESLRELELKTRVLLIGSSEQYGDIDYSKAISENEKLNSINPYGISKDTQEKIAKLYVSAYNLDIIMVRAFNHIGPGQSKGFVVPDFASQIIEIEKGKCDPIINVGNLSAKRDFTDVRDIVRGYRLILEKGVGGEIYNIGSGEVISIQSILDKLIEKSKVKIEINIDKSKLRPIEIPAIKCDNSKIKKHIGWNLQYKIDDSLNDILNSWREE